MDLQKEISEIDTEINRIEMISTALKLQINSSFNLNISDLLKERTYYKSQLKDLHKRKKELIKKQIREDRINQVL